MANKKIVALVCIALLGMTVSSTLCIGSNKPTESANLPPTVQIEADITNGFAPLTVNFKAEAEDPDGFIGTYDWDFGDGSKSSKEKIFHTFFEPAIYITTLTVEDSNGAEANDSITIIVKAQTEPNESPNAQAQVLTNTGYVNEEIIFNGTGEDSDGWIILFEWNFDGDGAYDWHSNTTGTTGFAYNKSGVFNAVFRVTDNDYDFDTDSVLVTINSKEDKPPIAVISEPENEAVFNIEEEIQFNGSGSSDPEQAQLTYIWDFGDGEAAYDEKPVHEYSENGTYTVVLTVSDGYNYATDSIIIYVIKPENHPPNAEIVSPSSDQVFEVDTQVYFDGTNSSDPDGDILIYNWDFGDGNSGTGATTSHVYTEPGTFIVTLVVNDGELTDSDTVRILITNQSLNQPPVAVINEPQNGDNFTRDEEIMFNGSGSSDPDDDELNFTWDFKDGTFGYGMITMHQYSENGTYNVTLEVSDGQYSDTAQVVIRVGPGDIINTPPTAIISEPARLSSHETNQIVNCSGYLSFDPENDPLIYDWDFGDGSEHANEENTTHKFTTEGIYLIRLTVSDGVYNDTDSVLISVVAGDINNSAPTAVIVEPSTGDVFVINEVIYFDGSNSSDPDGDKLTYSWNFGDGNYGNGINATHQYSIAGMYTIILEASDGELNDTDRVVIIIKIQLRSISSSRSSSNSKLESSDSSTLCEPSEPEMSDCKQKTDDGKKIKGLIFKGFI